MDAKNKTKKKPSGDTKPKAAAETSSGERLHELRKENQWLVQEVAALKKRLEGREDAGQGTAAPWHGAAASMLMRSLLASTRDVVIVLDQDGHFIAGSDRLVAAVRADSFERLDGLYVKDLYALFEDRLFAESGERQFLAIKSGEREQIVSATRIAFPDREKRRFYTMRSTPIRDDAGGFAGVLVVGHDATPRPSDEILCARSIIEATPLISTLWDVHGNLIDCNQEAVTLFGLKDSTDYIEHFYHRVPECQPNGENSRDMVKRLAGEVMVTGYQRFEWVSYAATGEPMPSEVTAVRIPWQEEDDYCIVCYARDLRQIQEQERRARAMEERASMLLDHTPMICTLWGLDGDLRDCNQEALNILGFQDKGGMLKGFYDRAPECQPNGEKSRDMVKRIVKEVFATGYQRYEWMTRTAAGEPVPVETTSVLIPWEDSYRVISYSRDLREIKARERQAREVEERARIMLDAVPDGVVLIDREYNILDYNQSFLHMFGFPDQLPGTIKFDAISPELQPDGTPSLEQADKHNHVVSETGYQKFEWMHCTVFGEPLPAEVTVVRVPWQGGWCHAACVRDLRGLKAHEQQMREANRHAHSLEVLSKAAQMASQAKSEFLARMSHELRTPLNAVIGFLDLELQKNLPQETIDRLGISLDACHNLLRLINDILDISKIEAGRFILSDNDYHLAALITDVLSLNAFRIEDKPIAFHLEADPNLPSTLRGDDLRIKQVLTNLLSNAFKYTKKGMVTFAIGLEPEEQAGRRAGAGSRFIRFNIQDTGQGIETENLEKLFTSYTRFDSKTNRLIEGTGLGLAISKHLVEMMGGWIEVKSAYGQGSVFSCIIPQTVIDPTPLGFENARSLNDLRDAPHFRRSKRDILGQDAHLSYAKVLVVDDVPTNLAVAQAMLERYGMSVHCASSGQEAIDLVCSEATRYNAIFMDHMMPGMSGIEALRHIRAIGSPYARSVPIIILTADVIAGNEKMFLEQGFQAFVGKPIEPAQLDEVVHKWVKDARQEVRPGSPRRRRSDVLPSDSSRNAKTREAADDAVHTVAGLNMREAISRFGSKTIFVDVLRSYAANMPDMLERMRRPAEDELAEFAIIAHGIKGTSYSVGANILGDMAKELERAAKGQDWLKVREALPAFLTAAEELLRGIGILLHDLAPAAAVNKPLKPAPDPGQLAALRQASLSCSHSALEEHLQALDQYQYQSDGELVAWLRARADALDYDLISQRLAGYASQNG
jgi:PAS domain S-box-containing protein